MSRDSDSRIIPREEDAVREWLASDRMFHIMRDHPWHCRFIVGCEYFIFNHLNFVLFVSVYRYP